MYYKQFSKALIFNRGFFIAVIFFFNVIGTTNAQNFKSLNKFEKRWFVFHPRAAFKTKRASSIAINQSIELAKQGKVDNVIYGGTQDVARHVFWMNELYFSVGYRKALKIGLLHERDNKRRFNNAVNKNSIKNDSVLTEMDIRNNQKALSLIKLNKKKFTSSEVLNDISTGTYLILKRDVNGNSLNVADEIISMEELKKWNNKSCLVPSNYKYNEKR